MKNPTPTGTGAWCACWVFGAESTAKACRSRRVQRSAVPRATGSCQSLGSWSGGSRVAVARIAKTNINDGQKHTLKCVKTPTSVQAVVDEHEAPSSVVSVVNLERADTWARKRAAELIESR